MPRRGTCPPARGRPQPCLSPVRSLGPAFELEHHRSTPPRWHRWHAAAAAAIAVAAVLSYLLG